MGENDISRGERGPAGDKGAHGQAGDMGLTGVQGDVGHEGPKGERGDTGPEGKSSLLARHVSVSFVLIVLVTTLVLAAMGYAITKARDVSSKNTELIASIDRQQNEIQRIARQTHDALCAQRVKDTHDIERSRQYLADVKAGKRKPIIGITEEDILFSIADEQAKVDSLSELTCP